MYIHGGKAIEADKRIFSFFSSLESIGCVKDREVNHPCERNVIMKIRRESWAGPIV